MNQIRLSFLIVCSAIALFFFSSLRHFLIQSSGWDLAIFDQALYLISEGKPPISSILGFPILGDHAAFIFYVIALIYKVYPDVHWLFLIQAIALSIGAIPVYHLSLQVGLKETLAKTLAIVYLLYPLIFNINLFDFHTDVIVLPAILFAVLAAYQEKILAFTFAILIILSCKAVFSLTVAAMGIWLLFFKKKPTYGMIALIIGSGWFIVGAQLIIPLFRGEEHTAISRYGYLGDSTLEIAKNLFFKPKLVLSHLFTLPNLEYLLLLFSPVIWGLSFRYLSPLVAASPALVLNLITDYPLQKDLLHQYSLPILPFLLIAMIETLAAGKGWFQKPRWMIVWGVISFIALAKVGFFWTKYLVAIDTWEATREAITVVETKGNVLTTNKIAPHLSHREVIKLAREGTETIDINQFEYILLNLRHPGRDSSIVTVETINNRAENHPEFQLSYDRDGVILWQKGRKSKV
jgi:uncharacterized membrane protein